MVKFFAKLFIKNYNNTKDEKVRTSYGSMAGFFGIFSNIILVAIKLFVGIISGSISIIADAMNNLSDMGSSILTIIGFKISSKPADKDHPFGHQRVEYIFGLIIAMIVAFVGFELLKESIGKIVEPVETIITGITMILLGVSILIKIVQGLFYLNTSKLIDSISLKASAKDSFNDCISTFVVLVGVILTKYIGWEYFDGIFGVLVSLYILYSAINLIKEASDPLIGEKPDPELIDKICKKVESYEGVYGIHDVITHLYGPSRVFISLHTEVDSRVDVLESHELIDLIENEIKKEFNVEITIHLDPIVVDDEEVNYMRKRVKEIVKEIDDSLDTHDFRMVKGEKRSNLIFDIVVPYQFKYTNDELIEMISSKVKEENIKYVSVINIDNVYV